MKKGTIIRYGMVGILGILLIICAPAGALAQDGWASITLDSEENVGGHTSLALDADGYVHISYMDYNSGYDLKYATNASGDWVYTTLDSEGIVGEYTSLAVDADGHVHISYYHSSFSELKYATNASGDWVTETLDSTGLVGKHTSLALDADGYIHISYLDYHVTYYDLKYATNASGDWVTETLDSTGTVGEYTSLALDSDGYVHISYFDETNGDLKYATNASGDWVYTTLDSTDEVGSHSSIALDSNGYVHISYFDETNGDLKYATNASGDWVYTTLDSTDEVGDDVGRYNSLALDVDGHCHISYADMPTNGLKYATNASGDWVTETVDRAFGAGRYTSLALDTDGYVHISYCNSSYADLKYATNVTIITCVSDATGLQAALSAAQTNTAHDIIQVVQGTYNGNFTYSSGEGGNITLEGGYTAGCASREIDPDNTILYGNGPGSGSVLYLDDDNGGSISVQGFTIQNGHTTGGGGGVYASSSSYPGGTNPGDSGDVTLTNNTIEGNTSSFGGGVQAVSSSSGISGTVTLTQNTITGNTTSVYGGGVYALSLSSGTSGDVTLTNNTIEGNTSGTSGGGVYAATWSLYSGTLGTVTLTDNIVRGNDCFDVGGGVYAYSYSSSGAAGTVTLINNIIAGNSATSADGSSGGVFAQSDTSSGTTSDVNLTNNTITGNSTNGFGGGATFLMVNNTFSVYNNIIWGNTAPTGGDIYLEGTGTAYGYNNDYNPTAMYGSWTGGSDYNINVDPEFIDPDNGDYRLRSSSGCKDVGLNTAPEIHDYDFEGDTRIIDGTVDIGADEVSIATTCVSTATELQDALDDAEISGKGDVIMVQQGLYTGNFTYSSDEGYSITLLGGYTAGCSSRVLDPANTIIDGNDSGTVLSLGNSNGEDILVDGFTMRNGYNEDFPAGLYAHSDSFSRDSGNIIINNNTIIGNNGGAMHASSYSGPADSGTVTINKNVVNDNIHGGIVAESSAGSGLGGPVIIINNEIIGNIEAPGGVYAYTSSTFGTGGNITIANNTIAKNTQDGHGGGVHAWAATSSSGITAGAIILANNTIIGNTANYGGGMYTAGDVTLTNNTITGNTALVSGGGVDLYSNGSINIYNNIIWGNTAPTAVDIILGGISSRIGYNNDFTDIDGYWTSESGNIDAAPLFVNVTEGDPVPWDPHLRSNSPCIDAGDNSAPSLPATDFEGHARIINGTVDMGADEALVISASASSSRLCPNGLGFGEVQVDDTLSLDLIMNNTTGSDIVVGTVSTPIGPYSKPSDSCDSVTLHPGDTCTITIQFTPASVGTFYDAFQIPTDDPEAGTVTVALSGIGVTGGSFEQRGSSVPGPGATSGVVPVPDVSVAGSVDVTPASPPVVEGPSSTSSSTETTPVVTPESSSAAGSTSGSSSQLMISSLPPDSVREPYKQILLDEAQKPFDSMVFGEVKVGASDQLRIVLSHKEGSVIKVGDIILPSAPYVIVEDKCSGIELGAGSECSVTVQFTPPSADNFYDYFLIPTDDPGVGTLRINLEGLGVRGVKK